MKVYIVEDDEDMRFVLKRKLKRNFPSVTDIYESPDAEQALNEICRIKPDLVLVDISLPGMSGIDLIRLIRPRCRLTCILIVTGHELEYYRKTAFEVGADNIISKSNDTILIVTIKEILKHQDRCGRE